MRYAVDEKSMGRFVGESLRTELAAAGFKVSTAKVFNRANGRAVADGASAALVDRVLVGRINYFGFVSSPPEGKPTAVGVGFFLGGAVGALVGSQSVELNDGTAYVDVDLWVLEPSTGKILWTGTARAKQRATGLGGVIADKVAVLLPEALHTALNEVIPRPDFILAMGATLSAARASAQSASHEQNAQALFRTARFAEAADEFRMAYQEAGDPALIFDAGLCYRQVGDSKQAHVAFKEYVRQAPPGPARPTVEERIQEVRRQRRSGN